MAFNLRNRNFLKLLDFTPREIQYMIDLAIDLKKAKYGGYERKHLPFRQRPRFYPPLSPGLPGYSS